MDSQHHDPPASHPQPLHRATSNIDFDGPESHARLPSDSGRSPSWRSGDTIPVTPNTMLQNFANHMPIGAAVSTEVSASIGTASHEMSSTLSAGNNLIETHAHPHRHISEAVQSLPRTQDVQECGTTHDGVATRRMTTQVELPPVREPRLRLGLIMLPRLTSKPLAGNCLCFILHPDHHDIVVAEGRTGGSWKSPSGKFGKFCSEGEQIVQSHKIYKTELCLIFTEDRHKFTTIDQALVKPVGSKVYVKWLTQLLHPNKKTATLTKSSEWCKLA